VSVAEGAQIGLSAREREREEEKRREWVPKRFAKLRSIQSTLTHAPNRRVAHRWGSA
jgi:hypothetical protein